ncbi:MAG: hypothetical protein P8Y18_11565, partial [Candidatus Bathyarchaeota archaeon]
ESNPNKSLEAAQKILEYGHDTKDNFLIGFGNCLLSWSKSYITRNMEDPEKQKESFEEIIKTSKKAMRLFRIIQHHPGYIISYLYHIEALSNLASIESEPITKQRLFEKATEVIEEGIEYFKEGFKTHLTLLNTSLGLNLRLFAETKLEIEEKRKSLNQSQFYFKKNSIQIKELMPYNFHYQSGNYYYLALTQIDLAKIEKNLSERISLFEKAIFSLEEAIKIAKEF